MRTPVAYDVDIKKIVAKKREKRGRGESTTVKLVILKYYNEAMWAILEGLRSLRDCGV